LRDADSDRDGFGCPPLLAKSAIGELADMISAGAERLRKEDGIEPVLVIFCSFDCKTGSQSHHGLRFPKPPYNPGRPDFPGPV
jgi:hypothetical protein